MSDLDSTNSNSDGESSGLGGLCSGSSANKSEGCQHMQALLFFLKADRYITQVFYPLTALLIIVGTVLNLLSLYCFLKMKRRHSQHVYLSVLSLVDTLNLHINFALPLLRKSETFDTYFRNSKILCRLTGVLTEFFLIFPTWIVVLLTVERLIFLTWPIRRRPSYAQTRTKISIILLAFIVLLLSLYRIVDVKGIDQISVFAVVACNGTHEPIAIMRNLNLIIWTILPECLTLIMSLIIVYQIKLAAHKFQQHDSTACQTRYNQATKTVLLISILFLIFHTPTGIMIGLNIFYHDREQTLGIIIILVSRKLTITFYEISLCCKFFIYHQTLNNFRMLIHLPINRLIKRTNSAKLGQSIAKNADDCQQRRTIHFGPSKRSMTSPVTHSDSYTKSGEEQHNLIHPRNQRTLSTNISRTNRENQPLAVLMSKTNEESYVTLPGTPDLLRNTREKKRSLWSSRPQITL